MQTQAWVDKKTELFNEGTASKIILPINFFDDRSLNGHCGVELKVVNKKAVVVITALEDNPGIDVTPVINLVCMSIYENFLRLMEVSVENILWVVNRPVQNIKNNMVHVTFKVQDRALMPDRKTEIIVFYRPVWGDIFENPKKFFALSQLHLQVDL